MKRLAAFGDYLGLDRAGVGHALRLALAAWIAFATASLLHVQFAYWAAMPIWVVAQSSRGLLIERAFFRVIGTLLGAAVGFGLVQLPIGPYGQLALLSLWIALNAGLTHVLRGVHGYGALMSGMTAAIVAIPALLSPSASRDLGVARVACTLIGVVVVTLVTGLRTPGAQREALYERVRQLSADALAYAAHAVRGDLAGDAADDGARVIVTEISSLDATARLITAGSVEGYQRLRHVDSLIVGSLSAMAAAVALGGRVVSDPAPRAALGAQLDRLASRVRRSSPEPLAGVATAIDECASDPAHGRLKLAVDSILEADAALLEPNGGAEARSFGRKLTYLAPHREWTLALHTAALAGVISFVASAAGYASGWPEARLGALGICIIFLVLSSMAQPQVIAPHLVKGMLAGVTAATLYRFAIQPAITSTFQLLISIAPFLLIGGFARASRRTALPAIDFNMGFLLASQAGMPAEKNPGAVLGGSLALLLGAGVVAGSFILLPRRHDRLAWDAATLIRTDLRRMIEAPHGPDPVAWHARVARQILRLTLHLGRATELGERLPRGTLAALNLGHAIGDLHALDDGGDRSVVARVRERALAILEDHAERPRETASALRELVPSTDDAATRQVLLNLADSLALAEDVLNFGKAARTPTAR